MRAHSSGRGRGWLSLDDRACPVLFVMTEQPKSSKFGSVLVYFLLLVDAVQVRARGLLHPGLRVTS